MTVAELLDKVDGFEQLSVREQVKLLCFFHCAAHGKEEFTSTDIRDEFIAQRLKAPTNVPRDIHSLAQTKPPIILKSKSGWTYQRTAKKELEELYLGTTHKRAVSITLRALLEVVAGDEQKGFLEEAISCFEIKAFRAAIIMTWLLTLDVIYEYILAKKLTDFNAAIQAHGKYKKLTFTRKDDFSDLKESDFLEIARSAGVLNGDIRKILVDILNFRNTCAHPNTVVVAESKAISVIEDLVRNVVKKFQ